MQTSTIFLFIFNRLKVTAEVNLRQNADHQKEKKTICALIHSPIDYSVPRVHDKKESISDAIT
jgi:hypothetical protein